MSKKKNTAIIATATANDNLVAAVKELANLLAIDAPTSKTDAASSAASKALATLNAARQRDAFAACITSDAPVLALAEMGTFSAVTFSIDDETFEVSYSVKDTLLSLHAFCEYATTQGKAAASDNMWRGKVKDACHVSMVKLAQGLKVNVAEYLNKVKASDAVCVTVKNAARNNDGELSYKVTQAAIQSALDAVIFDTGDRDDGLNKYRADRASCRWLEASFDVNRTTAAIVNPKNEGMYARLFQIIRHVCTGMPYSVEVAEQAKKASK